MARMINADDLLKSKTIMWDPALGFRECVLVDDIEKAPTVGVLCGDCKHWRGPGTGFGWCEAWDGGRFHDNYCNYGEKKNVDA